MLGKNVFLYSSVTLLLLFTLFFLADLDSPHQPVARLSVIVKHAKHNSPAEVNFLVSSAAVSLYKEGEATAPIVVKAVSDLLGEKSPAVRQTLAGLVKAGANTSLLITAGQQAGMSNQEVFVALVEGGIDPATITTSTAAGGLNLKFTGGNGSASSPSAKH